MPGRERRAMRRLPVALVVAVALTPLGAGASFAGQPNASCEDPGANPPPGFGTSGFANAEAHYAGSEGTPSAANSRSGHAVSQYDIACFRGPSK
jgi:hypothetical protein